MKGRRADFLSGAITGLRRERQIRELRCGRVSGGYRPHRPAEERELLGIHVLFHEVGHFLCIEALLNLFQCTRCCARPGRDR